MLFFYPIILKISEHANRFYYSRMAIHAAVLQSDLI